MEFTHDGLVIHSRSVYTVNSAGKRVYEKGPNVPKTDSWFEFEADLYPPLMLSPVSWQRYEYTVEDVHNTYEKMDASYMWQLALMFLTGQSERRQMELESASTGIRSTFQSLFSFLFIFKKSVFDMLLDCHTGCISKRLGSSLCYERTDHKPLLPKIQVPEAEYRELISMVPDHAPSFRRITHYPKFIRFKDVFLVPVEHDSVHELVLMHRVVSKQVYDAIPTKPKPCAVTLEVLVTSREFSANQQFVMVDEACFFEQNNKRKLAGKKTSQSVIKKQKV